MVYCYFLFGRIKNEHRKNKAKRERVKLYKFLLVRRFFVGIRCALKHCECVWVITKRKNNAERQHSEVGHSISHSERINKLKAICATETEKRSSKWAQEIEI